MPFWPSSKLNTTVKQTEDVTEASSTNPVDITGLSVYLPRAGTYHVTALCPFTAADSTSRTMGLGLAYSGTATAMKGLGSCDSTLAQQATMGTLATRASQSTTNFGWHFAASVVVSTAGTLQLQFSRSAASITHLNGIMTVREG